MKKAMLILWTALSLAGLLGLTGCSITPGVDMGIDFDYYGGKFHARPTASVGLHGRP